MCTSILPRPYKTFTSIQGHPAEMFRVTVTLTPLGGILINYLYDGAARDKLNRRYYVRVVCEDK